MWRGAVTYSWRPPGGSFDVPTAVRSGRAGLGADVLGGFFWVAEVFGGVSVAVLDKVEGGGFILTQAVGVGTGSLGFFGGVSIG